MNGGQMAERARQRMSHRLRRGAYLLPSLFTIGNMFLGFYAVICAYHEADQAARGLPADFSKAAYLVFAAAFVDFLDGFIARLVGTESEFGREYDSLADVLTFGAVPAYLTYLWGLKDFHPDAWLICFFFMVCTATRLARFNVQTKVVDSRWFVGLPTPAAASAVCSLLFFSPPGQLKLWMQVLVATALFLIGLLMVSTFRYASLKNRNLRKRWSFRSLVPIVAIVLLFIFLRQSAFLALAVVYTFSGPVMHMVSRLRSGGGRHATPPEAAP